MKLATVRTDDGTTAVRLEGDEAVELGAADVGEVLRRDGWEDWAASADGARRPVSELDYAQLITAPAKIACCGMNYRAHIQEFGRDLPEFPTLFAKYTSTLCGPFDDIALPPESELVDWEVELAVIIGRAGRRVSEADAPAHIAGYAVLNDVSMRDYQNRTMQWLQGKCWEATTPLGPWLVTADECPGTGLEVACEVDGVVKQQANTDDLLFSPAHLVSYLSDVVTLEPGDVIATGTPGGVGFARNPPEGLVDGSVMVTRIDGLGECRNTFRAVA